MKVKSTYLGEFWEYYKLAKNMDQLETYLKYRSLKNRNQL